MNVLEQTETNIIIKAIRDSSDYLTNKLLLTI